MKFLVAIGGVKVGAGGQGDLWTRWRQANDRQTNNGIGSPVLLLVVDVDVGDNVVEQDLEGRVALLSFGGGEQVSGWCIALDKTTMRWPAGGASYKDWSTLWRRRTRGEGCKGR
jgi:hypothetical protein